jgi:hypothetical protein
VRRQERVYGGRKESICKEKREHKWGEKGKYVGRKVMICGEKREHTVCGEEREHI